MNFNELINTRQSCRNYDESRVVEKEKIIKILEAGQLSPSACNGQPYHFTVCEGDSANEVAVAVMELGMNKFADKAPVMIVISEEPYVEKAAFAAKVKNNDFRSIDIGIATAQMTLSATEQGLSTCIIGWFNEKKIQKICNIKYAVRIVLTLGYAKEDDVIRAKKRKSLDELVTYK